MIERITDNSLSLSAMLKRWVMATLRSAFSAMGILLVACLISPCIAGSLGQERGTGIDVRGTPRITATPEHVKVSDDSGSSDIAWNTGNGSKGFVFVTANGRPPVLVATGNEGSRVISWIRRGNYVFELYGDAERRTLLATVTVSGVATEPETLSKGTELSHGQLRWLVFAALLAVLYAALYLSSTGPVRTKFPLEPATSPHPLHVARNLLLGLATFICVDGVVFHTRLYTSILAPDSYAGRMAAITGAERNRVSSGLKEVLVLGDSRMAEGFSPAVANKLSSLDGFKFVNLTEPASAVNIWDYMLREVDPTRRRYWAIVVPYGIGFEPNSADPCGFPWQLRFYATETASILRLLFSDGRVASEHLQHAYCEARHCRATLSIFSNIQSRVYEASSKSPRDFKRAMSIKAAIMISSALPMIPRPVR